jgi:DNA-directed RNA polymerase specialized sigma24 family protein
MDSHLIAEAVVRAILLVSNRFDRYDPTQGSLNSFLLGFARRFLAVLSRTEQRRHQCEQKKAIDPVTATDSSGQSPLDRLADRELAEKLRASLELRPDEVRVLDLWLQGERDRGVLAAALGQEGQSQEEQATQVDRLLTRIRQRLHRLRLRLRREGEME